MPSEIFVHGTYVVGMSKEKLFGMVRNDEFLNIHATYSFFIESTRLRQTTEDRDS